MTLNKGEVKRMHPGADLSRSTNNERNRQASPGERLRSLFMQPTCTRIFTDKVGIKKGYVRLNSFEITELCPEPGHGVPQPKVLSRAPRE